MKDGKVLPWLLSLACTLLVLATLQGVFWPTGFAVFAGRPTLPAGTSPYTGSATSPLAENLAAAYAQNPDVSAWLTLPGTGIDAPVLQAADNDTYLRRNMAGEYDVWGCFFADYECRLSSPAGLSRITIVYGHSLDDDRDGPGFSQIKRYEDEGFCAANPIIYFSVRGETSPRAFAVFSAGAVPKTLDYIHPNPSGKDYAALLQALRLASAQPFAGVPVNQTDRILILSTCTAEPNTRFVLAAKQIPAAGC